MLIANVAACHSATRQEEMQAAQHDLINEAMALQRCEGENGYASGRCADQQAAYHHDLATFQAKYGR